MDKKGISIMIGYVLLISSAIIIGAIVYNWMKTYVPAESIECPDGVSIFINDLNCVNSQLNLTLKNNGRFEIDGYFIHATNSSTQELATIDLSSYAGGTGGMISFPQGLKPNQKIKNVFNFNGASFESVYSIEIIPIKIQAINNKIKLIGCSDSKVKEKVSCI